MSGLAGWYWTEPCEWRGTGSVAAWMLGPIDRDVSCGSSGGTWEERLLSGESAERGGGARDVNGGE